MPPNISGRLSTRCSPWIGRPERLEPSEERSLLEVLGSQVTLVLARLGAASQTSIRHRPRDLPGLRWDSEDHPLRRG